MPNPATLPADFDFTKPSNPKTLPADFDFGEKKSVDAGFDEFKLPGHPTYSSESKYPIPGTELTRLPGLPPPPIPKRLTPGGETTWEQIKRMPPVGAGGTMLRGNIQVGSGVERLLSGEGDWRKNLVDISRGAQASALPLAVLGPATPLEMAFGLAASPAVAKGAEKAAEYLGGDPETQELAGEIGGWITPSLAATRAVLKPRPLKNIFSPRTKRVGEGEFIPTLPEGTITAPEVTPQAVPYEIPEPQPSGIRVPEGLEVATRLQQELGPAAATIPSSVTGVTPYQQHLAQSLGTQANLLPSAITRSQPTLRPGPGLPPPPAPIQRKAVPTGLFGDTGRVEIAGTGEATPLPVPARPKFETSPATPVRDVSPLPPQEPLYSPPPPDAGPVRKGGAVYPASESAPTLAREYPPAFYPAAESAKAFMEAPPESLTVPRGLPRGYESFADYRRDVAGYEPTVRETPTEPMLSGGEPPPGYRTWGEYRADTAGAETLFNKESGQPGDTGITSRTESIGVELTPEQRAAHRDAFGMRLAELGTLGKDTPDSTPTPRLPAPPAAPKAQETVSGKPAGRLAPPPVKPDTTGTTSTPPPGHPSRYPIEELAKPIRVPRNVTDTKNLIDPLKVQSLFDKVSARKKAGFKLTGDEEILLERVGGDPFVAEVLSDQSKKKGRPVSERRKKSQRGSAPIERDDINWVRDTWDSATGFVRRKWSGSPVEAGVDYLFKPLGSRVRQEADGLGNTLMDTYELARDRGAVKAGVREKRIIESGMDDLSTAERYNLLDVLQGKSKPVNDLVEKSANVLRGINKEIRDEALGLNMKVLTRSGEKIPFAAALVEDYDMPHRVPTLDELKGNTKVRRSIIENLARNGAEGGIEGATKLVNDMAAFWEKEATEPSPRLIYEMRKWNRMMPEDRIKKIMMDERIRRPGAHGPLEFARELNSPFFDPDPVRVMRWHADRASRRLEFVRELGQFDEKIVPLIDQIRVKGGDERFVINALDQMLGRAREADSKAMQFSRFMRGVQQFKLGLASIPNSVQWAYTALKADMPTLAKALWSLRQKENRMFHIESGAGLDPVIHEFMQEGGGGKYTEGYLKATGFMHTENFNRMVASNVGREWSIKLVDQLKRDPTSAKTRGLLKEMGIDPDKVLKDGLSRDDMRMAGLKMSDMTQGRIRPEDVPAFASTPAGKMFFQFKTFGYRQAILAGKSVFKEFKSGNLGRAARNLALLAILYPAIGDAMKEIRDWVTGRERDEVSWEEAIQGLSEGEFMQFWSRYANALSGAGAWGIVWNAIEAGQFGTGTSFLAGPTLGLAGDVIDIAGAEDKAKAIRQMGYRHAPFGQIGKRVIEPVFE